MPTPQEASKVLELLSRDYDQQDVVSVGFVINGPKLLFALADSAGALRLMEYVRRWVEHFGKMLWLRFAW